MALSHITNSKVVYQILKSELRREYLWWQAYRVNTVSSFAMWGIIYPIMLVSVRAIAERHNIEYGPTAMGASIIGFLMWRLCMSTMAAIPEMIEQEARLGTLETVFLAAYTPVFVIILFRVIARILRIFMETGTLALVMYLFFRIELPLSLTALLVILPTLMGACGVGFALAGLALVYKSISSLVYIISILALFISGAAVPLNSLGVGFTILKYGFPTTWGIDILRGVLLFEHGLFDLMTNGELLGLYIQSILFVIVGSLIFSQATKKIKANGQLGTY